MPFQRIRFEARPMSVRAALQRLERGAVLSQLGEGHRSAVLLALAEVMNNIAEHAYHEAGGDAAVSIWRNGDAVAARIVDCGRPAPPIPAGGGGVDPADFPEGGFGFQLIRILARDIRQRRKLGCNMVRLCVDDTNGM